MSFKNTFLLQASILVGVVSTQMLVYQPIDMGNYIDHRQDLAGDLFSNPMEMAEYGFVQPDLGLWNSRPVYANPRTYYENPYPKRRYSEAYINISLDPSKPSPSTGGSTSSTVSSASGDLLQGISSITNRQDTTPRPVISQQQPQQQTQKTRVNQAPTVNKIRKFRKNLRVFRPRFRNRVNQLRYRG